MGSVYLASHEVLGRRAAVKVLLPEFTGNAELVARFFREARATAQLRHHAFVEIFDSGRLGDGSAYLVMEYLRGESLAAYLRRVGPLPVDDALAIARDIAEGVGFAHAHGIIHRDLKPDNVFLTVNAGEPATRSGRRRGQDPRLRHRQADGRAGPRGDRLADAGGRGAGDAALHGARAVPGLRARSITAPTSIRSAASSTRCCAVCRRSRWRASARSCRRT